MGAVGAKVNRAPFPKMGNMSLTPLMVAGRENDKPLPADDLLSYAEAVGKELAIACVNAGRADAAMHFLRAVLTLQRPLSGQPNAAEGDAA